MTGRARAILRGHKTRADTRGIDGMQADKGSFFQRAALGHATRAAIIAAALTLAGAQVIAAEVADRVLHGGKVYTLNSGAPWAEAVAIRGDPNESSLGWQWGEGGRR